jgi:hypothetical protein
VLNLAGCRVGLKAVTEKKYKNKKTKARII